MPAKLPYAPPDSILYRNTSLQPLVVRKVGVCDEAESGTLKGIKISKSRVTHTRRRTNSMQNFWCAKRGFQKDQSVMRRQCLQPYYYYYYYLSLYLDIIIIICLYI